MTVEGRANATLPASAKVNILMVDDQPANLLALEAIVNDPSLNLVRALSGEQALEQLGGPLDFAVILLDVRMQGLDGFQTAQRIRNQERTKHTPIIFLTAFEDADGSVVRAYNLGGVDYLIKPLIPEILRAKVAGFVELYRKTEQIREQAELLRQIERERAEEALRESRQRLDLVAESINLGLWSWDLTTRGLVWNDRCREQFGVPPDVDVTLELFNQHLHPDDRPRLRQAMDDAIAHRSLYDVVFRTVAHGAERWIRAIGRAFYGDNDRPLRFDGVSLDVTEQKRIEEALKETDRRKDEFLAMLSHELRNPLAPLINGLHLARRVTDPGAREQALDLIGRQVTHLTRLVEDLLDVTRITRGKIQLNRETLDLARLMQVTAEDRSAAVEQAHLSLRIDTPTEPIWVDGDPTRLTQILNNLLHNALKFTEPGGTITVRLAADQARHQAVLEVCDSGVGIDRQMLPRLFEVFAQADRSLERTRGGLGLGLAVVKGLAELHGGSVEASSDGPGCGARFTVRLPLAAAPVTAERDSLAAPARRERLRVLIIEDNRDTADSLRRLLELLGHDVRVAYSGNAGVAAARAEPPDAVLCDIGLPGMNGYDIARALRDNPATEKVRLFAITGYGQDDDRRLSREAGFDFHLTKPVDPAVLVDILGQAQSVG